MREKKKVLVRVRRQNTASTEELRRNTSRPEKQSSAKIESTVLTPLSHNLPRRARTVHAKDDETIVQIACRLNFDPKKLMKLNRSRYPSLTMHARLMEGTVLALDSESRELEDQIVVENPWTTGIFGPYVSNSQRNLNEVYSDLVESSNRTPYSLDMFNGHLMTSETNESEVLDFRGFCENEFSDIWHEFEPHIDVRTLDAVRKGNICTNTCFRFARYSKQKKRRKLLDEDKTNRETDTQALFRINRVNTSHFDSPSAFEEALTHKNEFIMMARRRTKKSSDEFENLLSKLENLDRHKIFGRPVLETYPELSDIYNATIREPMDFSTIRSRLEKAQHYGIENIRSDFVLMCDNAMKFNPNPDCSVHRQASVMKRDGLKLIDSFHIQGVDCGFVHYYIMYWKGSSSSQQPVRVMYVATLQAVKPETHPDCEVRSESWTGTTLLTLAMEHARRLGIPYCVLDATAESVNFYRRFFDFKDGVREGKYYPMCMSLSNWRPELTLSKARTIPQRYVMRLEVQDDSTVETDDVDDEKNMTLKFQQGENGLIDHVDMRTSTKKGTCKGFETMTMMRSFEDSLWHEISKLQTELSSVRSRNQLYRDRAESRIQDWQNKTMLTLTKTEMERIEAWKHIPKGTQSKGDREAVENDAQENEKIDMERIQVGKHVPDRVQSKEQEQEKEQQEEAETKKFVGEKKQEKEEELYCLCRTPWNDRDPSAEPMYNCEHCDGWFHLRCLGLRECKEEMLTGRCVVDKKGIHWNVEKCFLCDECQKSTGRTLSKREHQHQRTKKKRGRKRKHSSSTNELLTTPRQYLLSNSPRTTSSSGRSVRKVNYIAMLAGNYVEDEEKNCKNLVASSASSTLASSASSTPSPSREEEEDEEKNCKNSVASTTPPQEDEEKNCENMVESTPSASSPRQEEGKEVNEIQQDTTSPQPQPQQATTQSLSPRRESSGSVLRDKVNTPRESHSSSKVQVSAFVMLARGQRAFWGDKKKRKRGTSKSKKSSVLKLKKKSRRINLCNDTKKKCRLVV